MSDKTLQIPSIPEMTIPLTWHNIQSRTPDHSGLYLVALFNENGLYSLTDLHYSAKWKAWNWRDSLGPQPTVDYNHWTNVRYWADQHDTHTLLERIYNLDNNETKD